MCRSCSIQDQPLELKSLFFYFQTLALATVSVGSSVKNKINTH